MMGLLLIWYLEDHPKLGFVVSNYGLFSSPKDWVVYFPFQMTMKMAYKGGLLNTY